MSSRRPSTSPGRSQSLNTQQIPISPRQQQNQSQDQLNQDQIVLLIKKIIRSEKDRAEAVPVLIQNRDNIPDLGIFLWFSPATATSLLSDVLNLYPQLISKKRNMHNENMAFNSLNLLQTIAEHPDSKLPFVRACIPTYLFPVLHLTIEHSELDYITGALMAIFTSIVKDQQSEIINYLINSGFLPICLKVLSLSNGIIQTAAAFVLSKILADDIGLRYATETIDKSASIIRILNRILEQLGTNFSPRLSKNIVESYKRLLPLCKSFVGTFLSDNLRSMPVNANCDAEYRDLLGNLRNYPNNSSKR